jgi:hypothetical protein
MLTKKEREIYEYIIKEAEDKTVKTENRDMGLILAGVASGINILVKNIKCEVTINLAEKIFEVAEKYVKGEI